VANCWAEEGREKIWWFETEAGASKCVARGGIGGNGERAGEVEGKSSAAAAGTVGPCGFPFRVSRSVACGVANFCRALLPRVVVFFFFFCESAARCCVARQWVRPVEENLSSFFFLAQGEGSRRPLHLLPYTTNYLKKGSYNFS
jgi:hypothetical protein